MLKINRIRHAFPEKAGFKINRPNGSETKDHVFLHFHTRMDITLGGETVHTRPGALIIYERSTPEFFGSGEDVIHDWMHIDGDLPELMREYGLEFDTLYYPRSTGFITECVRQLENEHFSAKRHSQALCDALLRTLLIRISRAILDGERDNESESETVKRLRELRGQMFAALEEHPSVNEMAARVNLSQSRFFALYRQVFGISPTKDLIMARIERAKLLLTDGASVTETAYRLGYSNVFHFIRQFKDEVGMTPGQFAK